MAMPPDAYMEAQRDADLHLQVRVVEVGTLQGEELGEVPVRCEVVKVFHGKGIKKGDGITFAVKAYRPPAEPMPDAGGWINEEDLRGIRYLEVYLDRTPEGFRISADGSLRFPVDEPTRKATQPRPGWLALRKARRGFW